MPFSVTVRQALGDARRFKRLQPAMKENKTILNHLSPDRPDAKSGSHIKMAMSPLMIGHPQKSHIIGQRMIGVCVVAISIPADFRPRAFESDVNAYPSIAKPKATNKANVICSFAALVSHCMRIAKAAKTIDSIVNSTNACRKLNCDPVLASGVGGTCVILLRIACSADANQREGYDHPQV